MISVHGEMPKEIEVLRVDFGVPMEELNKRHDPMPIYWTQSVDWSFIENEFANLLPEIDSWSDVARLFGNSDGDSVQIWKHDPNDGPIERLTVAFSLAEPNVDFIKSALAATRKCGCVLHAIESMAVIEPIPEHFVREAKRSRAYRFVPEDYDLAAGCGLT